MNPAYSIIFFTTASGAGYGLIALLGLYAWHGALSGSTAFSVISLGLAIALVSAGLISSTYHLGHPERAWRGLSQWRSSWLSREGVAAVLTYVPVALFAIAWIFVGSTHAKVEWLGALSALGALVTVLCTGMIYASLRAIPAWNNGWVVATYVALGAMTGALWLSLLASAFGVDFPGLAAWTSALIVLGLLLKLAAWHWGKGIEMDRETATGLGTLGGVPAVVVPLDPPHTEKNFLQREMGYVVARKHAARLREHAVLFAFALPLMATVLGAALSGVAETVAYLVAALSGSLGVVIERWLFFAEARHAVSLYYPDEGAEVAL